MRRPLTPLALLAAACSLRPYTLDSATDDGASAASSASTTGTSATTDVTAATIAPTAGGAVAGTWRGLYHRTSVDGVDIEHAFLDCTTQQLVQLRADLLPEQCHRHQYGWGLFLHVAGVLHPDGDDPDTLEEIEVLEILDEPCADGSCYSPFNWSACGPWENACRHNITCDVWMQDCPEGQKCMPYSGDGDNSWESLKCVPVAPGAGGAGDPCTAEGGGVSGVDTCAEGHMCWYLDPQANGTCVPQCTGSPDAPTCEACHTICTIAAEGVLQLCLPTCSPLEQDCADNEVCIANMGNFICVLDASGDEGQVFDPCEYANACDPGLLCVAPESASECDQEALGCCLPFCDLAQPVCPGAGLQCVPWSDPEPECNKNLGVCRLPP